MVPPTPLSGPTLSSGLCLSCVSGSALCGGPFVPHLDGAVAGCTIHTVGEHVHVDGAHGARVTVLQQA
eukprot:scaffold38310_cov63-Phaeocystis_antarctica.AAC.3